MTHETNNKTRNPAATPISLLPIERKIGNTTYITTAHFNPNARDGLLTRLWHLIQNDED
jgi:hypothetical protein